MRNDANKNERYKNKYIEKPIKTIERLYKLYILKYK